MEDWLNNLLDVVGTQGKHLLPRLDTPVWENGYSKEFASTLACKLDGLLMIQRCRQNQYREAADEWPIGRTPPEVKERHEADLREMDEWFGLSDDAYDAYWAARGEKPYCIKRYRDLAQSMAYPEEDQTAPRRPIQAGVQELPQVSSQAAPSCTLIAHTDERREAVRGEEDTRSAKVHVASDIRMESPTEEKPSPIRATSRKRRRDSDADDTDYEEVRRKGRLAKVRKPVISPSRWQGIPINAIGD
ncbi:hypothetical protein F5Y01DRAFT_291047 [Xylaria sp. FL0043]|nr:hypothetical protein F5Y01DRAFT_291047 [Xylaria sp. FL0043]